jgi:hypothetical protein
LPDSLVVFTWMPKTSELLVVCRFRPNIPTGKAMRVKRSSEHDDGGGGGTECDGASTIELLHTRHAPPPVFSAPTPSPHAVTTILEEDRESE